MILMNGSFLGRPILLLLAHVLTCYVGAQSLSGKLIGADLAKVTEVQLLMNRGADQRWFASAPVDDQGGFRFAIEKFPKGFYQLAVNDSDRVDIILDPRETSVNVELWGVPLQDHIRVIASAENRRLWTYKQVSRESQMALREINDRRIVASPMDTKLLRSLDSLSAAVADAKQRALEELIDEDVNGYFRHVVKADMRLMSALNSRKGPQAIRDSVDWTDASLARSNIYPKGIMAILQSATPATADQLMAASDSILAWSAPDAFCWELSRHVLIELFIQYGPADAVQYLVDRYVIGPGARVPADAELMAMVAEQLKVAVGARAPDVLLPRPGVPDVVHLSQVVARNKFTVLFFYSSTCDHCHEQMPGLSRIYTDMRNKGVAVIGIALDHDVNEFEANIKERVLPFPCYTELLGWGSPAAKAFAIKATPSLVVVDGAGVIKAKPYDHEELRELLEGLLR
jgi:peroxiredoxin